MPRHYRRDTCRLCGGRDLHLALPLPATPIADDYVAAERRHEPQPCFPTDLWLCLGCGHVQLLDVVDPEDIYREYLYVTRSSPGLVDYYRRYADEVLAAERPAAGALVVDIGSNDGALLRAFRERGCRVQGIDPARAIAAQASAEGIPTIPEFLTPDSARTLIAAQGRARIATANNIVANVDELAGFFATVETILAPDGTFVLETGYWGGIVDNLLFDTIYHEHLSYFSLLPMQRFLAGTALQVVDVQLTPSKGGCIRYHLGFRAAGRTPGPRVAALAAQEQARGLHGVAEAARFRQLVEAAGAACREALDRALAAGRRVVGYGASNTTTTLLYAFGLGPHHTCLVDDNPLKHGRFSPGLHLPVVPSNLLERDPPDLVVVNAWRFADQCIARHSGFAGTWLVPMPVLRTRGGSGA